MSLTMKVPVNKVGAFERMLGISIKGAVESAMKQAARQSKAVLVAATQKAGAVATGHLRESWDFNYSPGKMTVEIINSTKYSGPVEYGVLASTRKLGDNALRNLETWVAVKLGRGGAEGKKIARAIRIAINKRTGWRFQPRQIARRSSDRISEIFNKRIQEALDRARAKAAK